VFAIAIGMVGPTILAHGTDEQRQRYLPAMLRGDEVWCQLFSEPEAGSDLASLATRAVLDGDEWVATGQKVWTSVAERAEWGILLARTDLDVPKHAGITYFLLDMRTPGIEIRPLRQMTGHAHFSEVFLDDVRVPAANVLGGVGDGWKVAQTTLASERTAIAGGSGGADPPGLAALARQLGKGDDPLVRQAVVEAHLRGELLRYLRLRAQTALSQGRRPGAETSVMKLAYARFMQQMTNAAMHVQGATAMLAGDELPAGGVWTTKFLHAPSLRIAGGSDQVQANIIGERVLGLPAEARVDRDVAFRDLPRAGR
jgi:acyl-CoA dehydrogenase